MKQPFQQILELIDGGQVRISAHEYDKLAEADSPVAEKMMTRKRLSKLVHEGDYVAEVEVELIYTDDRWSPYLSLADALKLDEVREALRQGDLKTATRLAQVFRLMPVTA